MSYESAVRTLQRLREEHRGNPDAEKMLSMFAVDIGMQRVDEIFHTSFLASLLIECAKHGRFMNGGAIGEMSG